MNIGDTFTVEGVYQRQSWPMRLYTWWTGQEPLQAKFVVTDKIASDGLTDSVARSTADNLAVLRDPDGRIAGWAIGRVPSGWHSFPLDNPKQKD